MRMEAEECCEDGHSATWHHVLASPPACLGCPPKILSGVPADKTVIPTNPVRECSPRAYTLEREG